MAPPKSKIWVYFTRINNTCAKCNQCLKTVKYCGNTTNMLKHAKNTHGIVVDKQKQKKADKEAKQR